MDHPSVKMLAHGQCYECIVRDFTDANESNDPFMLLGITFQSLSHLSGCLKCFQCMKPVRRQENVWSVSLEPCFP